MIESGLVDAKGGEPPLLRCDRLTRTYVDGDVRALRGVSIAVSPGEFVAITGPSGCGKSTLMHLLGGMDRPTSGTVSFRGRSLGELDLDIYRAREVGFVFQSFHLIPTLSALENVQVPMFAGGVPRADRPDRARLLLERVGLSHRMEHQPSRLSIGERQRVAIARALANDPSMVFADEPTGNLDSVTQAEILDLMARLRSDRAITLVVVTHSGEVSAAADREVRLRDGEVVEG